MEKRVKKRPDVGPCGGRLEKRKKGTQKKDKRLSLAWRWAKGVCQRGRGRPRKKELPSSSDPRSVGEGGQRKKKRTQTCPFTETGGKEKHLPARVQKKRTGKINKFRAPQTRDEKASDAVRRPKVRQEKSLLDQP